MKKLLTIILCFLAAFAISACSDIKNPYVREYVAGEGNTKGDVDAKSFYDRDARFEIGATADGYAVFKDPDAAFDALIEGYADGLELIRDECGLDAVSRSNYKDYKTYGWQVASGTDAAREQARFVSSFFDIYENSFE